MEEVSFDEFCDFIRDFAGMKRTEIIAPESLFEDDLGITGDDGCELLEAAEKHFGVRLSTEKDGYRGTFNLYPNEFLFESEGLFPGLLDTLLLRQPHIVHEFKVAELFAAVQNALKQKNEGVHS